jgi:hypothetical protein
MANPLIQNKPVERRSILNFEEIVSYVTHSPVDDTPSARAEAGANFDSNAMCANCRQTTVGEPDNAIGNVVSIFSICRQQNGCVVCAYCGYAMLDSMGKEFGAGSSLPDCPKCGSIHYVVASRFAAERENQEMREEFEEWHLRLRCLDIFGIAAGIAMFAARRRSQPIEQEALLSLLYAIFNIAGLGENDETVNRFFDRTKEALALADGERFPMVVVYSQ